MGMTVTVLLGEEVILTGAVGEAARLARNARVVKWASRIRQSGIVLSDSRCNRMKDAVFPNTTPFARLTQVLRHL
jgi:hypothetical protein